MVMTFCNLSLLLLPWFLFTYTLSQDYVEPCSHPFFCNRTYLYKLGSSGAFSDSKTIVDLFMKDDFENFREQFDKEIFDEANSKNKSAIMDIVLKYFYLPGYEMKSHVPEDWNEEPKDLLRKIKAKQYKKLANSINDIWLLLSRKQINMTNVRNRTSSIEMPYPFVIPGDRFVEIYYWDSFWTMEGLSLCNMFVTVKYMIKNFLNLVDKYGFIPNGGRIYYQARSQPPFITLMVKNYVKYSNDEALFNENLHLLDKEYKFWMTERLTEVENFSVNQYRTRMGYERPESFIEDNRTAEMAVKLLHRKAEDVYVDLSSAAESGWDFSSRWLAYNGHHAQTLYSIRTTKIIPVCLNSILCLVAQILAEQHSKNGNITMANYYTNEAERRRNFIHKLMWNEEFLQWFDYDLETKSQHKELYASNFYPLYTRCHNLTENQLIQLAKRLNNSGYLDTEGGFVTSTSYTGEQWDFPNAWAPLQDIIIQGLLNTNSKEGKELAHVLAAKWVENNKDTFEKTGNMYEKYSAVRKGYPGEGGEYVVQKGFGWTNGVLLKYLSVYGEQFEDEIIINKWKIAAIVIIVVIVLGIVIGLFSYISSKLFYQKKAVDTHA